MDKSKSVGSNISKNISIFLIVAVIIVWSFSFTVKSGTNAVIMRFGNPRKIVKDAGLHFKLPFPFETIKSVDVRQRIYNTRFGETLTRDKKNIILLSYVVWNVEEPLKFIQAVGNIDTANILLDGIISNAKNGVMGNYNLTALVSTKKGDVKIDQIEDDILKSIAPQAKNKLGIKISEVGFKRIALPEENIKYVFQQMRAERSQFAAKAIAEGYRESAAIRSDTDLEKSKIVSEAIEKASKIRASTEVKIAKMYADVQRNHKDFFNFMRSIDALKKIMGPNATLILKTDSPPFSLLKRGIE